MKKLLMNESDIIRALKRISHEILERNKGAEEIILLGIKTRGFFIAKIISDIIKDIENISVQYFPIDVSNFRDDIINEKKSNIDNQIEMDLTNKKIILVDDVLYTGRTVRASLNAILEYGRPQNIQLAVLIDRGHRELPIRSDYTGKNLPTSKSEKVKVNIAPYDGDTSVVIE